MSLSLSLGAVGALAPATLAQQGDDRIPHQFVVRTLPGEQISQVVNDLSGRRLRVLRSSGPSRFHLLETCPPDSPACDQLDDDVVGDLTLNDRCESAEYNRRFRKPEGQTQSFFLRSATASTYHQQVAWSQINLGPAQSGGTGRGVVVAVLDTGAFPHPAIESNLMTGWNFIDQPNGPDTVDSSLSSHGTMVAGLIAMIAPEARILPVKVLDDLGVGDVIAVAEGIEYALDQGATVINLSLATVNLSGNNRSDAIRAALERAEAMGVTVVAAAANNNNALQPAFPASERTVIGVAATDIAGSGLGRASFSDTGDYVDVCAPGVDIASTRNNGEYAMNNGTSLAAAMVSGVAAIIRSRAPLAPPPDVRMLLRQSATDMNPSNPGYQDQLGDGRINAGLTISRTPCALDINASGSVNPDDLADYIAAYFAVPAGGIADFDRSGSADGDDLSTFITAYFNLNDGCPR